MLSGRRVLQSFHPSAATRARLGFAPHQLSAVAQPFADRRSRLSPTAQCDYIVPSAMIWRVFSSSSKLSDPKFSAPTGVSDAKFSTAVPLRPPQEPRDAMEEPASIKHFSRSSLKHPLKASQAESAGPVWENPVPHPVYDLAAISDIPQTHHDAKKFHEYWALAAVKVLRTGFDVASGYRGSGGGMTEKDWLHRVLFLETVAGVPGMVAGMARHLRSLRSLQRDYGWIHTLLEEAENERMHLLIFMNMKQPGWLFRLAVLGAQGIFFNMFFLTYLVSPKVCHRFVGYLEEEAVKTYTGLLQDIEDGHLNEWKEQTAPLIGRSYYHLPDDAKVYDMIKCIRADEANHRDVNHTFAGLDQKAGVSPFVGKH